MSTPPKRTATARQESTDRTIAPCDAGESTHVRRLPTESRTVKPLLSAVERVPAVSTLEQEARTLEQEARTLEQEARALEQEAREHDTIPCGPPEVEAPTRLNDLDRTLRFARLVQDTLATDHPLTRMLELAVMRRDGALLRAILKELHKQQTAEAVDDEVVPRSDRRTLLPPPPERQ